MKALYFDCFSGISGDMILGALLDMEINVEFFKTELNKLNIPGFKILIDKKVKCGIAGTDVEVILDDEEGYHHERNLEDIEKIIDSSSLNKNIKSLSKKVFEEIARAEAKVHNKDLNEVHFHEVGALDSIVDIVGAAICIDILGANAIFSSCLHEGQGFIECRHGILPVPVPAVMEMLAGSSIPVILEDVNTELVTPTGLGIIKCLADKFGNAPTMQISKVGYGMGKRETGRLNALRVVMGEVYEQNNTHEILSLETNIDDMNPQMLGYLMECLLENGARDVFYTPIYMKKNRPAVMVNVLTDTGNEQKLVDIILKESSTLGIRRSTAQRYCMDRTFKKIQTEYGDVNVKVASYKDVKKYAPEYEDCREIARRTGLSLAKVYQMVIEKAKNQI